MGRRPGPTALRVRPLVMAGAIKIKARLWEWQSIQGLIFVLPVCTFWALAVSLTWARLTPPVVVIYLLVTTLIPLVVGLVEGLVEIPRSVSLEPERGCLRLRQWSGPNRTRELQLDNLGELSLLSWGPFGSALILKRQGKARRGKSWQLTKKQARFLEGKVQPMRWTKG